MPAQGPTAEANAMHSRASSSHTSGDRRLNQVLCRVRPIAASSVRPEGWEQPGGHCPTHAPAQADVHTCVCSTGQPMDQCPRLQGATGRHLAHRGATQWTAPPMPHSMLV